MNATTDYMTASEAEAFAQKDQAPAKFAEKIAREQDASAAARRTRTVRAGLGLLALVVVVAVAATV